MIRVIPMCLLLSFLALAHAPAQEPGIGSSLGIPSLHLNPIGSGVQTEEGLGKFGPRYGGRIEKTHAEGSRYSDGGGSGPASRDVIPRTPAADPFHPPDRLPTTGQHGGQKTSTRNQGPSRKAQG